MTPTGYLGVALGSTAAVACAVLVANLALDPFALGHAPAEAEMHAARDSGRDAFWRKALAVSTARPATLILGTSRANTGLDAASPAWETAATSALGTAAKPAPGTAATSASGTAAKPAFNLALPGANVEQIRDLLVHARNAGPLRQVVVGLDLEAFLGPGRSDFDLALLAGNRDSAPDWMNRLRLHLSWRALAASAERLGGAHDGAAQAASAEGQRRAFQVTEFRNMHAQLALLFPRWPPGTQWDSTPRRAASMRAFRELLAYARSNRIDLRLFISPVHARYLELYREVGWWPAFEAWKRALVQAVADEAAGSAGDAFPLWDFSGYNRITAEPLPSGSDLGTTMRWYLESSHYSRAHGEMILRRVLEPPADSPAERAADPDAHGTRLELRNIEPQLRRIRNDAERYRAAFPTDAAEVQAIANFMRRVARR